MFSFLFFIILLPCFYSLLWLKFNIIFFLHFFVNQDNWVSFKWYALSLTCRNHGNFVQQIFTKKNNFNVTGSQGQIQGEAHPACARPPPPPPPPPLKFEKIWFFCIKFMIFHTKYPKNFRFSLRSVRFFQVCPPPLTWNPGSAPGFMSVYFMQLVHWVMGVYDTSFNNILITLCWLFTEEGIIVHWKN